MTKYRKLTALTENGVQTREEPEVVDEAWVERYISPATLDWFRNLGGTEQVTMAGGNGIITVRSVSPDGDKVRVTVFEPIKEES